MSTSTLPCAPACFSAFPDLDPSAELVVCTPYSDIVEYQGTRATLEAEGVIPADADWPEGFNDLHWEDDQYRYWLCCERGRPGNSIAFCGKQTALPYSALLNLGAPLFFGFLY